MIKFLSDQMIKSCGIIALAGLSLTAEAQFTWSPAGPIYTAGRVRNMIVDKGNPSILYVGSTSSGIFKSTDAGSNWLPLNDQGTIRNISYMAQSADGTIYAGTGEGFLRSSQKAKALPGTGLYKLNNNNLDTVANASITGSIITKVACHPSDPNQIAITSEKGILVSKDGGASFSNASLTPTGQTGFDIKFDNNGILYASIGKETAGGASGTIWKSDGSNIADASYSNITPYSGVVTNTAYGRIELGISPSNPAVIYASISGKANITGVVSQSTLSGLFVSYDAGANWGVILVGSGQLDPLFSGTSRSSGDYAHCIVVNPDNYNQILLGSYQLYAFTRTGGSDASPVGAWNKLGYDFLLNTPLYLHENIHDIKKVGTKFYFITDAGIYRSVDNMSTFQPFYKGLVTGQFNSVSIERFPYSSVSGSVTPYNGYIGGTGGNGLVYFRGNYPQVNTENIYLGGDIFNAEFSKLLPNAAYFTTSSGALYRNSDVKSSQPDIVNLVARTSDQTVASFANSSFNISGTPFKLWEYYGQTYKGSSLPSPDSLVFYNDTSFALTAIPSLTTSNSFTFSIGRPQKSAKIDHIEIRATQVKVAATPSVITIANYSVVNTKTLSIQCDQSYTIPATATYTVPLTAVDGFTDATPLVSNKVIINKSLNFSLGTYFDEIQIALAGPLFTAQPASTPSVSSIETYVRMKATVYYRYSTGDSLSILDDNISTLGTNYQLTANTPMMWTFPVTSTVNITSNALQKYASQRSARLAFAYGNSGIYVSKAPLDMNTPISLVRISGDKALTTDNLGNPTTNTVSVSGKPTLIEWSRSGTELYYATDNNSLYRVSHLYTILDSTSKSYSGKLHTGIFQYGSSLSSPTVNPNSPYRTTFLGTFPKKITSISVASNDSILALTFDDPTGTLVMVNSVDIRRCDNTNVNFVNKTGTGISNVQTYCSLMEKGDYKKVFIGTDNGLFYTSDITASSPTWVNANNGQLPNVQVFDIEQQTMDHWECYNSGQIYVATNGRGIWTNQEFFAPHVVSVKEIVSSAHASNLSVYPNPSNGDVFVSFKGFDGEKLVINVMDVNGRIVKTENAGKLNGTGDVTFGFETASLPAGVYVVNINSDSGIRRVSKLIVTK